MFDEQEFDEEEFFIYLIENDFIVFSGFDPDGDPTYKMTSKMIEYFPEIFEEHLSLTNNIIFDVWQKGLIEVVMTEEGSWTIQENIKTRNFEDYAMDLTKEEWLLMTEVKNMIEEKDV
jgi:hypothetical protein